MATNELLQKRFIYALNTNWYADQTENENQYVNSIVFIHNEAGKGLEIYTKGAYFKTDVELDDIIPMIEAHLEEGKNIEFTEGEKGELVINAVSVSTIDKLADADKTKLVEAQAVAGALSAPINLSLNLSTDKKTATFAETFSTLDGTGTQLAKTAVLEAGDNVSFESTTNGLKISSSYVDTTYTAGDYLTLDGTEFNHDKPEQTKTNAVDKNVAAATDKISVKTLTYDEYGHVTGESTLDYVLPATAFTDNDTKFAGATVTNSAATAGDGEVIVVTEVGNLSCTDGVNGTMSTTRATAATKTYVDTQIDNINKAAKSYTVKEVTTGLGANIETAYQLYEIVGENETAVGKLIEIPKDDSLVDVNVTTDEKGNKVVKFTYNLADGTEKEITLDLADYVTENEFGNGIEVVDGVASVKVKAGEKYLVNDPDGAGLYITGVDTAITTEIAKLDGSATATTNETEGIVNVLTSVVETDGIISLGAETAVATATYVEAEIEAALKELDAQKSADATATDLKDNEIAVVTGVDVTQTDGVITLVAVDSAKAATTTYVDNAINGLDSTIKVDSTWNAGQGLIEAPTAGQSKYYTKISISDGMLDEELSLVANISEAKLNEYGSAQYQKDIKVGADITADDTIISAIDKLEYTLDWGTI